MRQTVGSCRSFYIVEYLFHSKSLSRACGSTFQISVLGLLTPLTNNDPKLGGPMFKAQGACLCCKDRQRDILMRTLLSRP